MQRKVFDKTQCPFIIKTLKKNGNEGNFLYIEKIIYQKFTTNILKQENIKDFPLRFGTRPVF